MTPDHFRTFARYNAWANDRLYAACARLPDAEFRAPRQAFFGSIMGTLNHILVGDRAWLGRLEGVPSGIARLDDILFEDLVELTQARVAEDRRIGALMDRLDAEALARDLVYRTMAGVEYRTPVVWVLSHLFNHQTHHRGQAHALLSQTTVAPPSLDLIYFLRDQLRAEVCPRISREAPAYPKPGSAGLSRIAFQSALFKLFQISGPKLVLVLAKLVQVFPGEDAAVVHIVELDSERVVTHRLQSHDTDMTAARHDLLLAGAVALDFGRRAFHAQKFGREREFAAVVEFDLQPLLRFPQAHLDRPVLRSERVGGEGLGRFRHGQWPAPPE